MELCQHPESKRESLAQYLCLVVRPLLVVQRLNAPPPTSLYVALLRRICLCSAITILPCRPTSFCLFLWPLAQNLAPFPAVRRKRSKLSGTLQLFPFRIFLIHFTRATAYV
ncbi:hypothetical protein SLA2020_355600 [Shorea laevis]